jgi:glycosyltransferase involved in cell wall biosynthesis
VTILLDTYIFTKHAGGMAKVTAFLYEEVLKLQPNSVKGISQTPLKQGSLPEGIWNTMLPLPLGRETWRSLVFPIYSHLTSPSVFHFPANGLIPTKLPASTKVVMTLHDVLQLDMDDFYSPEDAAKRNAYIKRLTSDLSRTNRLITVSDYSKQRILHHFPDLSLEPLVIPNATTLTRPHDLSPVSLVDLESSTTPPYFLYTGRYEKRKGLEWLLDAFLAGHQAGTLKSQLLITGESAFISDAFSEQLKTAKALGIVEELGYVDDDSLIRLMNEAVALVYPSFAEGFGLPPLEAMNLFCPVITTNLTALPFTCGKAVYYVYPQDPASLLVAMQRLETEGSLRAELIDLGLQQVNQFSWKRSAEAFLEAVYSSL